MALKKKFSDIRFGAPLGKLEASATWKKCLEILMGRGAWEKCLRGCMRGCWVARGGTGAWKLPRVDAQKKCLEIPLCLFQHQVIMCD